MTAPERRTIVGVPFYDGEGQAVLEACLKNIDGCLNHLAVDAKVVVGINGPRVSMGQLPLAWLIDQSRYNADITFIKTPPGLVAAEKEICRQAVQEGQKRIFLTDADISRLPHAFSHMWQKGDRPVVGANYSAYPPQVLEEAGTGLTSQEIALMRIFEADKHPLARVFTWRHRPEKRLKGSLLLIDPEVAPLMFGCQGITSDSRMNMLIPKADRQIVPEAAFMHYARVSLKDHVRARLRHFRAAAAENVLDAFTRKSLIYSAATADSIARKITQRFPQATDVASDFLLQCALRHQVAAICHDLATGKKVELRKSDLFSETTVPGQVCNFAEASMVINRLLSEVDWADLDTPVTNGKGVTQNDQRIPLDLEPFLTSEPHRRLILSHLGLDKDTDV